MYQTPWPFWRAVLDISWGRFFVYTMGRSGLGRFWLIRAVLDLGLGRFGDWPFSSIPTVPTTGYLYALAVMISFYCTQTHMKLTI